MNAASASALIKNGALLLFPSLYAGTGNRLQSARSFAVFNPSPNKSQHSLKGISVVP